MGAVQKISIELSEELVDEVEAGLARGEISSWNELIEEALEERWRRRPEVVASLRELVREGLESGTLAEGLPDVEDIHRRGMERLKRKREA